MTDTLQTLKDLEERLFTSYGNPLAKYKKTHDDVRMTYYVGRLMEELGHKWIQPQSIRGEHEDRAYFSEKALHDAFLAGQLLAKADNAEMRRSIISELRAELHAAVDNMELWYNIIMTDLQEKLDVVKAAREAARDAAYAADAFDDDAWAAAWAAYDDADAAYVHARAAYAEAIKTYLKWTLIQS